MMTESLRWQTEELDGQTVISLEGDLDEESHLEDLVEELGDATNLQLNLSKVRRVNSIGVREWLTFMRSLGSRDHIELSECAPPIVAQLNMIANFGGDASIKSVLAPFVCDECGHEETVLIEITPDWAPESLPERPCKTCNDEMVLDDLVEAYFSFSTRKA